MNKKEYTMNLIYVDNFLLTREERPLLPARPRVRSGQGQNFLAIIYATLFINFDTLIIFLLYT
jgi:hypothetical protein